ncbi:hypothetical protein [Aquimarina pacifica]|uniref:hypothetical protein n=1 Tax=Aquimarina pacifica TaxID=1296415 RepID=UPI000471411C|nr:hypothetical protein [Aquimarina pacifica]
MKINWLSETPENGSDIQNSLKQEYNFRQKTTMFLLELIESKDWIDLSLIEFDFCPKLNSFSISKNTPEPVYSFLSELSTKSSVQSKIPWLEYQ